MTHSVVLINSFEFRTNIPVALTQLMSDLSTTYGTTLGRNK